MSACKDAPIHRAELLPCDDAAAMQRVDMLRSTPGYACFDTLHVQLQGLLQTRRPSQPLSRDALVAEADAFLRERPGYGTWVHYPWSRRLVRLLPEAHFFDLRTSRNQLKITAAEQRSLAMRSIGIVGLSVGQSIAFTLAMERTCGELRLADFDTIELSNLNRLRCGVQHLGVNKAIVAAREIAELDPYLRVTCFVDGYNDVDADAFMAGLDLVVEECDSLDVKVAVREEARRRGIAVLMNTSDRGMTDIERFDLEPTRDLFHGRVALPPLDTLRDLDTRAKTPLVLDILGVDDISARMGASMLEIGSSLCTWPQLAADVTLGGAIVTDVARRLLLGAPVISGRFLVDLDAVGRSEADPGPGDAARAMPHVALRSSDAARADERLQILADARWAPSAGNQQPWQWQACDEGLLLGRRDVRHASVLYGAANLIGLGAALETARISAESRGYRVDVGLAQDDTAVARLALRGGGVRKACVLRDHIPLRRSDRSRPAQRVTLDPCHIDALRAELADESGFHLAIIDDDARLQRIAHVAATSERFRMLDDGSHSDFVNELCWNRAEHERRGTGICIDALQLHPAEQAMFGLLRNAQVIDCLRDADAGQGLGAFAAQLVVTSSAMCALYLVRASDETRDYLAGGAALQRIWLRAAALGVGLCPVGSICFQREAERAGKPLARALMEMLPSLEREYSTAFALPEQRRDIVMFRLVAKPDEVAGPRTLRLPVDRLVRTPGREEVPPQATTTRSRPSAFAR